MDSRRWRKEVHRAVEAIAQARTQGLPDDNPIEQMWSQIKAFLPKAKARTLPALLQTIAAALQTATSHLDKLDERAVYLVLNPLSLCILVKCPVP